MTLRFNLRTFRLDMKERTSPPQCFMANVNVSFVMIAWWGLKFFIVNMFYKFKGLWKDSADEGSQHTVELQWLVH